MVPPVTLPAPTLTSSIPRLLLYLMKSLYSIQKTPSLLPWGIRSWRRGAGQWGHSSDQLPFQEKRPHGFRSRSNLKDREQWGQTLRRKETRPQGFLLAGHVLRYASLCPELT